MIRLPLLIALIVLILTPALAVTAELTVTDGRVMRPMPKFVQKLSPADFKVWAAWQQRQAERRQAEQADNLFAPKPYTTAARQTTVTAGFARASHASRTTSSGGGGKKGGGGDKSKAIVGYSNLDTGGMQVIERGTARYVNPDYVPTPAVIVNPYCPPAPDAGIGDPDWDTLFVPCERGTQTMTEALNAQAGPVDPEKLYARLMAPFFLD
jgi:hypothetical protein